MRLSRLMLALPALALVAGCAAQHAPAAEAVALPAATILARSIPAAGASVAAPVNALVLEFNPPALLNEVVVTGPDGAMPMMLSPAGEQKHYELPLAGLGTGTYRVTWRASAGAEQYRGDFAFTVK